MMSHNQPTTIPSLEEIGPAITHEVRERAITRLDEAKKQLNAVDSSIEKLRFEVEVPDEDVIAQLPALVNKSYELSGEIKGLKLALGIS